MGNALNMADMPPTEDFDEELPSQIGKVQLFVSSNNPEFLDLVNMQPTMTAEAPVTGTIQPVLEIWLIVIPLLKVCLFLQIEMGFNFL